MSKQPPNPAKPRVKVYGLVWLTRKQYALSLLFGLILLLFLTPLWYWRGAGDVEFYLQNRAPSLAPYVVYVPWIVLAFVVVEAIEAWLVLRKFAALEKETRARSGTQKPVDQPL